MPTKRTFRDEEIEYYFERRRYGTGPSMKFFCWIIYRIIPRTKWDYAPGDPFPKVTPNKKEMAEVLADIRKREAEKAANPSRETEQDRALNRIFD